MTAVQYRSPEISRTWAAVTPWLGLRVVTVAGDLYGAVVAGGITFAFLFQVFVNVGMTMGIAPVTGIPLPFVTVGGSSMVANLVAKHMDWRVAQLKRRWPDLIVPDRPSDKPVHPRDLVVANLGLRPVYVAPQLLDTGTLQWDDELLGLFGLAGGIAGALQASAGALSAIVLAVSGLLIVLGSGDVALPSTAASITSVVIDGTPCEVVVTGPVVEQRLLLGRARALGAADDRTGRAHRRGGHEPLRPPPDVMRARRDDDRFA